MTILIDMDDTIEHLLPAWVEFLDNEHGLDVKPNDITEWDITKFFPTLTDDQVFAPLLNEYFWDTVKPIPGATETIKKLIDDGHKVYIVTASRPGTLELKLNKVLFKYFPYLSYENVIVAFNKQMIIGDVMIDDAPFNLIGGRFVRLLMDSPANAYFKAKENGIIRVRDWEQIYKIICSICG